MRSNLRSTVIAILLAALAASTAAAGELVVNGSFETGDFGPSWVHGAYRGGNFNPNNGDHIVVPDLPFGTGGYSALLGYKYTTQLRNWAGFMYQEVTLPTNISSATLYYKVRQQGYDSTPYDPFRAQIRNTSNNVLQTVLLMTFPEYNYQFKDSGWLDDDDSPPVGFDMMAYEGQTVRLYFEQANTIDALYETWAFVDEVSLIYTKFVDLSVDGDGDDVFGNLGTGAGGLGTQSGLAGDTLSYTLTVENEGLDSDDYDLSVILPAGWSAWIDDGGAQAFPHNTGAIASGTVNNYTVYVVVPGGAASGSYDVIVDAASSTQPGTRFDSATLRATVTAGTYGVDLIVDGNGFGVIGDNGTGGFALNGAPWDSTVTYTLGLTNTGDTPTAFDIDFTAPPGTVVTVRLSGVPYTGPFTTPPLLPGGGFVLQMEVSVVAPSPGGDYATILTATTAGDPLKRDSITALLRLRAPIVDAIIGANGDGIYGAAGTGAGGTSSNAGERNTAVFFPVLIQNESSVADSFDLTWAGPGGGWSATLVDGATTYNFPFTTPTIPAYGEREYLLRVFIPAGEPYGTYPSVLDFVSNVDNRVAESVTATVSVSAVVQIDMIIDGSGNGMYGPVSTGLGGSSTQTVTPGDSVIFLVQVENNAELNSFDFVWNTPAGWTVTFDALPSPLLGHPEGTYELKVVVPATSLGGTFDIILDGNKSNKTFYQDSVLGRVVVTPPVVVDALIDGDGDGVYGALGSGTGGSSSQSTTAPALLNFTIELQNEGGAADQYTVNWSALAGWTATFAGAPAPFITTPISAGGSAFYTFQVASNAGILPGTYVFVVDVVSTSDPSAVESVEARVVIQSPPRVDLVIDGNGLGQFGTLGSGAGGTSLRASNSGGFYTAALDLHNVGSFPDSFYVYWDLPSGWPAGSVVINDGSVDHSVPFWTPTVGPASSFPLTVEVQVPAGASASTFNTIINSFSGLYPNTPESVTLITQTSAVVQGVVFEDLDQDGVYGAGDVGLAGVSVSEDNSGQVIVSTGGGVFSFAIDGGADALVIEQNPSGFVSTTPDSVGPQTLQAGDTLTVYFGDVRPLRLSAGAVLNGVGGMFIDFPHVLDAGTVGQVALTATADAGLVTALMLDANGNGIFDAGDRPLTPADTDMDPPGGLSQVALLVRVFIPATATVGTTYRIAVDAQQVIAAGTLAAQSTDAVVVVGSNLGRVTLAKTVDSAAAQPGDQLTYTISFFNAGVDSVQNVVILDPVSAHVDPVADAFGPGQDVEWVVGGGSPQYLTLDPVDADECEYTTSQRVLRLVFSKNSAIYLPPGERGTLTYRVTIR